MIEVDSIVRWLFFPLVIAGFGAIARVLYTLLIDNARHEALILQMRMDIAEAEEKANAALYIKPARPKKR